MNEIDAKKGKFLMRRIEYTPDYANIYCDINIKWLQEIYFKSIICMPKVLFGEKEFSNYYIFSNFISVDISEWENFINKIVSSFRKDDKLRREIVKNVNEYLNEAESFIDSIYKKVYINKELPTVQELKRSFSCFFKMDAFAVFNMFIPSNYYDEIFSYINMPKEYANIDFVMICSFLPHRIQVRKEKLELLKEYIGESEDLQNKIKRYMLEYAIYEKFEAIVFDNSFIKDDMYIKRELRKMASKYDINQIEQEILDIEENRRKQIINMEKFFENLKLSISTMNKLEYNNIIKIFTYLTLIVSEEERRHMIECKIFAIIAEIFNYIDLDISRSGMEEIINVYGKMKGE